jgi:hypothetical protein
VGRHFTLLIGHVVAPGAVAFFERRRHREVNGLSKVLLCRDELALGFEDCKGPNLLGLFHCHQTIVSRTHVAAEKKIHLNWLHRFLAFSVVGVYFDTHLLTHGKDLLRHFNRELRSFSSTEETKTTLELLLVVEGFGFHLNWVDGWAWASNDEFTATSVIRAIVIFIYFDRVLLIDGDELSSNFVHVKSNLTVPALGRKETWRLDIERHLEGEGELEFANLALVLEWLKVEQVIVLTLHYFVISVATLSMLI